MVYMSEGVIIVHSVIAGQSGEDRPSEAANITSS